MKTNRIAISLALVALVISTISFILNGNYTAHAQVTMKPYPVLGPTNKIVWDFDTGWVEITQGQGIFFTHNLGGDPGEYFVYLMGRRYGSQDYHQTMFGSGEWYGDKRGAFWDGLNETEIAVFREEQDPYWYKFRLFILKNQ
jgi:hypothetical protein